MTLHLINSVAVISPPRETGRPVSADVFLAKAVRSGWLTPPHLPAGGEPQSAAPVARLSEILDELDADRSER